MGGLGQRAHSWPPKLLSRPTCVGMVPLKLLRCRSKSVSWPSKPTCVGIEPLSLFE